MAHSAERVDTMQISKGMDNVSVVDIFVDSLIREFPSNVSLTPTGKVNLQCFRKACFLEKHKAQVSVGEKTIHANLLQVWAYVNGLDIKREGLTRSSDISPLCEAIAEYLAPIFPQFKWEAEKVSSKREERVSLDELFA
jgi:hypothetical protein